VSLEDVHVYVSPQAAAARTARRKEREALEASTGSGGGGVHVLRGPHTYIVLLNYPTNCFHFGRILADFFRTNKLYEPEQDSTCLVKSDDGWSVAPRNAQVIRAAIRRTFISISSPDPGSKLIYFFTRYKK
jgi:hypothetical protein